MTVNSLPSRVIQAHRILRIAGLVVLTAIVLAVFYSSNRTVNVHWLNTATTAELRRAASAHPDDVKVNLVLNRHLIDEGKYEQAFDLMTRLTRRLPGSALCWDHYAKDAAQTNQVLEAIRGYKQEIKYDPGAADAHATLGSICIKAGLMTEGLAQIDEAIRPQPACPGRRCSMG